MNKFQSLTPNRLLFDLAARLGSLEGYLYAGEKVEPSYLPNWLENVQREFSCLAPQARNEVRRDYIELLEKVAALLLRLYGEKDGNTEKVTAMIAAARRGEANGS